MKGLSGDSESGENPIMPNNSFKPALKTISIRLPEIMIEELKSLANKRDVPYQSLMKVFIAERLEQEYST
jgi:predicted DNA binding CopG/RHH family protein